MTNFEKLKEMPINIFAEWLDEYLAFDDVPHMQWFDRKYCRNCPSIMCHYENSERELPCSWCEIHGKCKFFQEMDEVPENKEIIKMWLESEVIKNDR